jgi:hypothetical protein
MGANQMVNSELEKIVRDQIGLAFQERDAAVVGERSAIISQMAARGLGQSGALVGQITALFVRELKMRGEMTLQQVFKVLGAAGVEMSDALGPSLKTFLANIVQEQHGYLKGWARGSASTTGRDFGAVIDEQIDGACDFATRKAASDIDIYVVQMSAAADQAKRDGATHVVVHGSVGNLQTGAFSSAHFSGSIDASQRDDIRRALTGLEEILARDNFSGLNKGELIELIAESKAEVAKDKPNTTRLRSLLSGIGSMTQYASGLRPAYENVRDAATWIGGLF